MNKWTGCFLMLLSLILSMRLGAQENDIKEHPNLSDTAAILTEIDKRLSELDEPAANLDTRLNSFEHATQLRKRLLAVRALIKSSLFLCGHGQRPDASVLFIIYTQTNDIQGSADAEVTLYQTDDITGMQLKTKILRILKPLLDANQRLFPAVADAIDAVERQAKACSQMKKK